MSNLKLYHEEPNVLEVGVDEAGRGAFLGPVYAGAVFWDPECHSSLIADSIKSFCVLALHLGFKQLSLLEELEGIGSSLPLQLQLEHAILLHPPRPVGEQPALGRDRVERGAQ